MRNFLRTESRRRCLKEEKNEVTDMVKEYQRRRDYAVKAINEIDGLSCRCPKGAFYIFINIEKLGMTGQEFAPLLLENAKLPLFRAMYSGRKVIIMSGCPSRIAMRMSLRDVRD